MGAVIADPRQGKPPRIRELPCPLIFIPVWTPGRFDLLALPHGREDLGARSPLGRTRFKENLPVILPRDPVMVLQGGLLTIAQHGAAIEGRPIMLIGIQDHVRKPAAQHLARAIGSVVIPRSPALGIPPPRHGLYVVPIHVLSTAMLGPELLMPHRARVAFEALVDIKHSPQLPPFIN